MADKFMSSGNNQEVSKDQFEELLKRIENKFLSANATSIDKVKRFSFICPICGKVDKVDYSFAKDPKQIKCSRCGTPFKKKDYSGFRKAIKKLDVDALARGGKPLPAKFEEPAPEESQDYAGYDYAYDGYGYPPGQGFEDGQGYEPYPEQYYPEQYYPEQYYPAPAAPAAPAQPVNINITNCPLGMLKNGEACDPEKCKAAECAPAAVPQPAPQAAVQEAPATEAKPQAPALPPPPPLDYGYGFHDFQRENNFGYARPRPTRDYGYAEYDYPEDYYREPPYYDEAPEYGQRYEQNYEAPRKADNTPKQQQSVIQPLAIVPYVSQSEPVLQYKPITLYRFEPFTEEEVAKAIENVKLYNEGRGYEVVEKRDIPAVETKKNKKSKKGKSKTA